MRKGATDGGGVIKGALANSSCEPCFLDECSGHEGKTTKQKPSIRGKSGNYAARDEQTDLDLRISFDRQIFINSPFLLMIDSEQTRPRELYFFKCTIMFLPLLSTTIK